MKKNSSKTSHHPKEQIHLSSKNSHQNILKKRNNRTSSTVMHTQTESHHNKTTTKKNSYSSISQNGHYLNRINSCTKVNRHENQISYTNHTNNTNNANTQIKSISSKANTLKIDQNRNIRGQTVASGNISNRKSSRNQQKDTKTEKQYLKQSSKSIKSITKSFDNINRRNDQLVKQNKALKKQFLLLQENQIKNKLKIQALISRISQFKRKQALIQEQSSQQTSIRDSKRSNTRNIIIQQNKSKCTNLECITKKKKLQQEVYLNRLKIEQLQGQKMKWENSKYQLKEQYQSLLEEIQKMKGQ